MSTPSVSSRRVKVWDLPTRLFHWTLVGLIVTLGVTGQFGFLTVHMAIGPAILALIAFRLIWGVIGSDTARFSQFVRGPKAIRAYLAASRAGTAHVIGHNPLGAFSVLGLLALVGLQAATGLFTSDDILSQGPLAHLVSAKTVTLISIVHRVGFNVLLALIVLHVGAVAFYKLVKKDDILTPMITGEKAVPDTVQGITFRSSLLALIVLAVACAAIWGGLTLVPEAPAY